MFSIFRFCRKLAHTKTNKAQTKQANILGVQYNSWVSTGSGVNFVLSILFLFVCDQYHLSTFAPLYLRCQPLPPPRSAAEIPCPIHWVRHRRFYHCPTSDMLGRPLIFRPLVCMRRIQGLQCRCCRSADQDTVDVFLPIMPDLVLLHLYRRFPHCNAYLL